MKSIQTNPNSAKRPHKGKIVNKLYCILLTTLEYLDYIFCRKNRHEVHYFSLYFKRDITERFPLKKKEYIKNNDAILLLKYDSAEKRY